MATDNTVIPLATGGDTIRDINRSGVKTQVVVLDVGGEASESLVTSSNGVPITSATGAIFAVATGFSLNPVLITPSDSVTFTPGKFGTRYLIVNPGNIKVGWSNGQTAILWFSTYSPYYQITDGVNQIFVTGTTATFSA
jgi:hypothetical protein